MEDINSIKTEFINNASGTKEIPLYVSRVPALRVPALRGIFVCLQILHRNKIQTIHF